VTSDVVDKLAGSNDITLFRARAAAGLAEEAFMRIDR